MPDAPLTPLARMFQIAHGYLPQPVQIPSRMMGMPQARAPEAPSSGLLPGGVTPEMVGGLGIGDLKIAPGSGVLPEMGGGMPKLPVWLQGLAKGP